MANFGKIIKIGAGAITAIVGGIVALKGAKSGKETDYEPTLEELGTTNETEESTEDIPEAEAEEVEPAEEAES